MHVAIREDAIGRPARRWQAVVITDRVAAVRQALEADAVRRLAIRRRGRRVRSRRQDDVPAYGHGLVGQAIQRVDDLARGRAVLADDVDRVEHALFDGDLLRTLRQEIDEGHHAGRHEDEQADPTEETE